MRQTELAEGAEHHQHRHRTVVLGLLALPLLAALLFYAFIVPQTPARLDRATGGLIDDLGVWSWLVSLPFPIPEGDVLAVLLVLFAVLAFAVYGGAVYLGWGRAAGRRPVALACGAAVVFSAVAVLALPTVNTDIFDYIAFGRVAAEHGANPYEVPPSAFADDPAYTYANPKYRDQPDNKLPAWQLVNRALAELGGDDPTGNLLLYRSVLFAFNLAGLALVGLIVRAVEPRALLAALIFYGWNPVVAVYAQSKTDTVMVFFFLLAAYLLVLGRNRLGEVSLAVSSLVKLITLPLAAVYVLRAAAQRRWRDVGAAVAIFAAAAVALYAPFGLDLLAEHAGVFGSGERGSSGAPLPATSAFSDVPRPLLVAGVLIAILLVLRWQRRETGIDGLLRGWGVVALAFAVLFVDPGFPWYLLTLVAASALARDWRVSAATVVLCLGAFLRGSWQGASTSEHPLPAVISVPKIAVYLIPIAVPALAAGIAWLVRRRLRRAGYLEDRMGADV